MRTVDVRDLPPASAAKDLLGSAEAFGEAADPYRRQLLVHCYRMLGSVHDAEDAVQETFARAWQGRATFQHSTSFRAWLYRIATNTCLDAIERRRRDGRTGRLPSAGPLPDDDVPAEPAAGPEARYDSRESVSLAFTTVLQHLPPRQRAVLILRDVLAWHADEVAVLLGVSVPAVNSALHRARTTMTRQYRPVATAAPFPAALDRGDLRSLLDRFVEAWEAADIPGLVALLREDAVLAMPPALAYAGREDISAFLAASIFVPGRQIRLLAIRANGGPGFAAFARQAPEGPLTGFAVILLDVDGSGVRRLDAFRDIGLLARFGLHMQIPA